MTWLDGFQRVQYPHTPGLRYTTPIRAVLFHTTEGSTFEGADSVFRRVNAAPHFTVDPWRELRVQHIDTDLASYALRNLPGGVETNTAGIIQIEVVGYTDDALADQRGQSRFKISAMTDSHYRWLAERVLAPILAAHPTIPHVAYHGDRMTGPEWEAWPGGLCVHDDAPENQHWDGRTLDLDKLLGYAVAALTPEDDMDIGQLAQAFSGRVRTLTALDGSTVSEIVWDVKNSEGRLVEKTFRQLAEDILTNAEVSRVHAVLAASKPGVVQHIDPGSLASPAVIAEAVRAELAAALGNG